jgi:hypothetical protein
MTAKVWWISYTPMSLSDTSPGPPLPSPQPVHPMAPAMGPSSPHTGIALRNPTPALQPLLLCARTTARKRPNTQHPHGGGGLVPIGTGRLTPPAMPALYHTHLYGFARVP